MIRSLLNTGSEVGLQAAAWLVGRSFSEALAGMRMAQWMPAEQLPVLNKLEIRSRLEEFVAEGVPEHRKIARLTSGSTGNLSRTTSIAKRFRSSTRAICSRAAKEHGRIEEHL